ncbi:SagB family peptide dehydrogenase [Paenibacillus eucommiae]|uniref:SagB-type dehydrogenase family enzyme n=1 Tax=Paenibacillus eucommiae TaxID=1355755 RepID=A0ABS4J2L5_9BACL|nr:SagB family peptide dehydrogenase [Paenibacillus eucommiae]MBP1994089.1 SagB-type dehydrogenase family enzyme [Paenibacillus eucommiae]
MSMEAFLHNLHYDTDKTKPPDTVVDWEDRPLAYKLYRGLPVVPLSPEVVLTLEGVEAPAKPNLRGVGDFLWYVFGLTQLCQSVSAFNSTEQTMGMMQSNRRFVPSGGALYPNELYVYLKVEDLPAGMYHYDVAHHRLVLLREGNYDSYLTCAIGNRCDVSSCFGTVFVSTMFWKNFFKYNNFAYRLQGLDAGALIGQLLEVAKRFGFTTGVCFQFLDQAVNHLLGISEQEESVYAVIPLSVESRISWFGNSDGSDNRVRMVSATELCRELALIKHSHYVRSRRVKEFPMLIKMNEASRLDFLPPITEIGKGLANWDEREEAEKQEKQEGQVVKLPQVSRLSYDLALVSRKRFSPDKDFLLAKVSQVQLAILLQEATASFLYRNDLDGPTGKPEPRVALYGCLYNVEGIPDGAYFYDSEAHALRRLRHGDQRLSLHQAMSSDNINIFQVPLCLHVAGDRNQRREALGYRGYRIQQMEAGMLVQRLLLAASAIGMGGHPLLGFNAQLCDDIYSMTSQGITSLIQIPVGPYRHCPRLEGGLHG